MRGACAAHDQRAPASTLPQAQEPARRRACSRKFFNDFSARGLVSDLLCKSCVDAFLAADYTSKINAGVAELADAPDSKEIQKQIVMINILKMQ
jgi:hypothetical protein